MLLPILAIPLDDVRLSVLGIVVCDVCVNSEDVQLEVDDDDDDEDEDDDGGGTEPASISVTETAATPPAASVAVDVVAIDVGAAGAGGSFSICRRQSADTILARLRRLALTNGTCSVDSVSFSLSEEAMSTASTLSTIIKFIGIFS